MLHTKPQAYWPFASREDDFKGFLPYMGVAAILVMWPRPHKQTFVPQTHGGSTWNLASIFEKMFENGGHNDDGGACLY